MAAAQARASPSSKTGLQGAKRIASVYRVMASSNLERRQLGEKNSIFWCYSLFFLIRLISIFPVPSAQILVLPELKLYLAIVVVSSFDWKSPWPCCVTADLFTHSKRLLMRTNRTNLESRNEFSDEHHSPALPNPRSLILSPPAGAWRS